MQIAVMGAGSIGGYFGGMLSRSGNQVTLIARGAHLEAIKEQGLNIVTDDGTYVVDCNASDNPSDVGPVDLVLLTVKTYHNEQAVQALLPMVDETTTVLCLQNGIDSYQAAAESVGSQRVMPGAAYIEASLPSPGTIHQTGSVVRIDFGEMDGSDSQRGQQISHTLKAAGISAQFTDDINKTLWTKFLFIATMAGVTSLSRETMAQLMPRPEWREVIVNCMTEIEAVGQASGADLDPLIVDNTIQYIEGSLDQMHASMHSDIMAGRPLELEALNGAVVRAGRTTGVPTPINALIYASLKPFVNGGSR